MQDAGVTHAGGRDAGGTCEFVTDRGDVRLRLDQVVLRHIRHLSRLSRAQVQRWIVAGAVVVDGRVAGRASARVREGASIRVAIPPDAPRRVRPAPEPQALDVLYEDADLLVLNKPAGIVVHPSYKQAAGTLLNGVLWRLRDRADARPGLLTRLDRDTSGVVIVALGGSVHAALQRDAAAGHVRKEYLAVVRGCPSPPSGRIVQPLARDPADRRRVMVAAGGAFSETHYEVLATHDDGGSGATSEHAGSVSLVRCELVTGRTHQIRVHLAWCGWPILGDAVYGVSDPTLTRQALHAWRITLPHPHTRAILQVTAPLPDDLQAWAWPQPVSG